MNELLLRTGAPALIVVLEVEGVTRLLSTANGLADEERLAAWLGASPGREQAVAWALLDRDESGGAERQERWSATLAADSGGLVAAAQELLRELIAAEVRERDNAGVIDRATETTSAVFDRG